MENNTIIRTPLKDLNSGRNISSAQKKECVEMKRKRKKTLKKLSNDRTVQGTLLNFLNIGNSSKQILDENKVVNQRFFFLNEVINIYNYLFLFMHLVTSTFTCDF